MSIIDLLFASSIAILVVGTFPETNIIKVIAGILSLALGLFASNRLGEK